MTGRRLRMGVDTGGTFTDVVAVEEGSGSIFATKTPSTPDDPSRGFMEGLLKVLEGLRGEVEVGVVSHGTTVGTNALLEEDFSGLALVTTEGFRHVLEIARQSVPEGYGNSYFWVKPERIVPLHRVFEVPERLDHRGGVVRELDREAAAAVAGRLRDAGVEAVGVCFLHSYADPRHERAMREIIEAVAPECVVSLSSDVLREYREYERTVTTLVDAFVKPRVGRYVAELAARLADLDGGEGPPFYVMKSNGGIASAPEVGRLPVSTILSGPAAGVLGAGMVARAAGIGRVLTLDAGGTSTDVSVVVDGVPSLTTEGTVGRFPVKVPMVDVVTVGTGGGSVAWVAPEGGLKVGPRSAGADPGPICYGRGGTEPTVTDAHLVLGTIPSSLLGGEMPLDEEAARAGLERLAAGVGLEAERCAAGVTEIAAWNQANAIRQVTVRRGLDVRELTMAAFGGSGPMVACRLLELLGLEGVLVPVDPANLSALGLLSVDVKNDYVQTHVARHDRLDPERIGAVYRDLEERARRALGREGFPEVRQVLMRAADLRYFGQASELTVPAPAGPVDRGFTEGVLAAFHDAHDALYGYCYRDDPSHAVEWVNLRVTGVGPIRTPELPRLEGGSGDPSAAVVGERPVVFGGAPQAARVYRREALRAGDTVAGPAVIEEFGATLPLPPGFRARADVFGNLSIRKEGR